MLHTRSLLSALALVTGPALAAAQQTPVQAGPQVDRFRADFVVAAVDFFGQTGLGARYLVSGCTLETLSGQRACVEITVERGIEAATGRGAARHLVTRLSSNAIDVPNAKVNVPLSAPMVIMGTAQVLPTGRVDDFRFENFAFLDGVPTTTERVTRTPLEPNPSGLPAFYYESFVPRSLDLFLYFTYRDTSPRPGSLPTCSTDVCNTDIAIREFTVTDITTTVPEPGTWALLGTGLLGLGTIAARRRKRADA